MGWSAWFYMGIAFAVLCGFSATTNFCVGWYGDTPLVRVVRYFTTAVTGWIAALVFYKGGVL